MIDEQRQQLDEAQQGEDQEKATISLEKVKKLAGRRTDVDLVRDAQGRVAIYTVPDKSFELPPQMTRGSRPLDWSPDHGRLMFVSNPEQPHLFEWVVATGEVRQLTSGRGMEIDGGYGPDGAIVWVAYEETGPSSGTRLWVRDPGEPPREITSGPADTQPVWSPDGKRIVYTQYDERFGYVLRWVSPDGSERGDLGVGRAASYSPDGEWIVYSAQSGGGWQLRRMRADGSGKRPFGHSGFIENDPSYSPDGRFVVFSANGSKSTPITRLFVRSVEDEKDRQLEFSGSGIVPVW